MVHGYKIKYKDTIKKINVELSVYNDKYKNLVLYDHENYSCLQFHIILSLMIIKLLFYILGIIPEDVYKKLKSFLINPTSEIRFIALDN